MAHYSSRFFLLTFILLVAASNYSHAQRTLGVQWKVPTKTKLALEQLQQFDEIGISVIELSLPVSKEVWDKINERGFAVYANLGIQYPTVGTFSTPDSSLINSIQEQASALLAQPSVQAVGFAEYGAIYQQKFRNAATPFISELRRAGIPSIYYTASGKQPLPKTLNADFILRDVRITAENVKSLTVLNDSLVNGYYYHPSNALRGMPWAFKLFLDATSIAPDKPIFVESSWLFSMIRSHSRFASILKSLTNKRKTVFSAPNKSFPEPSPSSLPIILLLIIWVSVAVHYNSSPLYRKSLFRYFSAHRFFINDIFRRQIRTAYPAIILIVQNAFLVAATTYAAADTLFSQRGFDALSHHFSTATMLAENPLGLAGWAFILSVALAFVSILWLLISKKMQNSFAQIATIYAWPLHINLLLSTAGIVFFASGGGAYPITIIGLLALLIQLLSFVVSSLDIARFMPSGALFYIFSTSGIYLLLFAALLIWGFSIDGLQEAVTLTIRL